jgi:hypothetical protein
MTPEQLASVQDYGPVEFEACDLDSSLRGLMPPNPFLTGFITVQGPYLVPRKVPLSVSIAGAHTTLTEHGVLQAIPYTARVVSRVQFARHPVNHLFIPCAGEYLKPSAFQNMGGDRRSVVHMGRAGRYSAALLEDGHVLRTDDHKADLWFGGLHHCAVWVKTDGEMGDALREAFISNEVLEVLENQGKHDFEPLGLARQDPVLALAQFADQNQEAAIQVARFISTEALVAVLEARGDRPRKALPPTPPRKGLPLGFLSLELADPAPDGKKQ